ncbi:MAG: glycoside hydrolase family 3 protein [Ruminococcus sp.]|nr:glycoside hydrolase family 3 protein [Ruminococcus sp.]
MNIKKILTAALGCCMILSGCGKVDVAESSDFEPQIVSTDIRTGTEESTEELTEPPFTKAVSGKSKKRSGAGNETVQTATQEKKQEHTETTAVNTEELPTFAPPENGLVVENPDAGKKKEKKEETTNENGEIVSDEENNSENNESSQESSEKRTPPKNASVQELMDYMTLEEKVCQMFIVTPEQLAGYSDNYAGEDTKKGIKNYPVGGIIYFANNIESSEQTASMIINSQQYAKDTCGVGLFISVDEEGGYVNRVADNLGMTSFYNMAYYGATDDTASAYNIGSTIGGYLSNLGFNLDFAPVADVNINPCNELGERIFSSNPQVVADMINNVVWGLQSTGVCATLKHFPGLGAEGGNTHTDSFVTIDRTLDQLRAEEFVPFQSGINGGVSCIMVGHQIVSGVGDNLPSDLSYEVVTNLLRYELGFSGIIITDSHQMNTIANVYGSGDSAVMAIQAGVDIVLMPYDLSAAVEGVCNAVRNGTISESRINDSVYRILSKKSQLGLM